MPAPVYRASLIVEKMKRGIRARKKKEDAAPKPVLQGAPVAPWEGIAIPYGYPISPFPQKQEEERSPEKEGIEINPNLPISGSMVKVEKPINMEDLHISYTLSPLNPKEGEPIFAYANIVWENGEVIYKVVEPPLSMDERRIIEVVKKDLEERLDIDFEKLGEIKAKKTLREEIQKSFRVVREFPEERKPVLSYYIERDLLGMGKLQPLLNDENIEDISCDGIGIPLYVFHRDPKFGSIKSSVTFDSEDELNSFVGTLSQKCNKQISIAEPLLDAALPDGSRIQATLGTDIARKGSNFTIRKFTEKPITPVQMIKTNTADALEFAYLWLSIENGKSILVSGGTATGKTSFLNALSLFIRPSLKIVSIEDTSELRLPMPHWIPHVARSALSLKGNIGQVTLFDLLRSSLRQRPDYIIVGEVRGEEAFVLFQQVATGHPSMATIHAATIPQLIDRLITPPISLPPSLIENIDNVVFLQRSRFKGNYVRRTDSIMEVVGIKGDRPETVQVFKWKPVTDSFDVTGKSVVLKSIAQRQGLTEQSLQEEIIRRKKILEWAVKQDISDYRDFARLISTYYSNPEKVIRAVFSSIS